MNAERNIEKRLSLSSFLCNAIFPFLIYFLFFFVLYSYGICAKEYFRNIVIIAGDYVSFLGTPLELIKVVLYTFHHSGVILGFLKLPLYLVQLPGVVISYCFGLPKAFVAITLFSMQSALLSVAFSGYVKFLFGIPYRNIFVVLASLTVCLNPYSASVITNVNVLFSFVIFLILVCLFDYKLKCEEIWRQISIDIIFLLSGLILIINLASCLGVVATFFLHVLIFYSICGYPLKFINQLLLDCLIFLTPLIGVVGAYLFGIISIAGEINNNVQISTLGWGGSLLKHFILMPRWVIYSADPPIIPLFQSGCLPFFSILGLIATLIAIVSLVPYNLIMSIKDRKISLALISIALIGLFLSKGLIPPFEIIYDLIYKLPYAITMFRESTTKFEQAWMMPLFALLCFSAYSCSLKTCVCPSERCKFNQSSNTLKYVISAILFVILISYTWPFVNGLYFTKDNGLIPNMVTAEPTEWINLAHYVLRKKIKVLVYPMSETYQHYLYGRDGMHSVDFLGFNFPYIENGKSDFLLPTNSQHKEISELYKLLSSCDLSDGDNLKTIRCLLERENIKMIALRNDMDITNYGFNKIKYNSIEKVERALSTGNVIQFGMLSDRCNALVTDSLGRYQCIVNLRRGKNFVIRLISIF